jgi:hypothetical protein
MVNRAFREREPCEVVCAHASQLNGVSAFVTELAVSHLEISAVTNDTVADTGRLAGGS